MKMLLTGISLLITVTQANAGGCYSWGCKSTITKLYTTAWGPTYIGTAYDENLANCTAESGIYLTLNMASQNAKEVYASILTAYSTGMEISLRIAEGSTGCEISYVTLE